MLIRALLVMTNDPVRRQLRTSLEELDIIVTEGLSGGGLWDRLPSDTFDFLLTAPAILPDPIEESIAKIRDLPERPEIILLSDEEDLELRAQLLAVGALAVVPASLPKEGLQETLSALIERQRDVAAEQVKTDRELDQSRLRDFSSERGEELSTGALFPGQRRAWRRNRLAGQFQKRPAT